MRGAIVFMLCGAAACASGTPGNPDAPKGGGADAHADAPITPIPDAPPGTPDAAVDATPPDATIVDAMPPDAMLPDGGPLGNGDTCGTANDISGQTSFTFSGDLTGLANDIEPSPSCTGFDNDGPDAIFIVTAGAGKTITASITTSWDSSIEILSMCAKQTGCVAGSDSAIGSPQTETTSYTTTAAGTYYVVVDSWDVGAYGPYALTITIQ